MAPLVLPFSRVVLPRAARLVKQGGLLVYPTDTVYGLGCDPFNAKAVERLFRVKRREAKPISVLCHSIESVKKVARLNASALRLAKTFWPGPLTLVLPMRLKLAFPIHQGTGAVGVRIPALPLCVELLRLCGGFLTGTSANLSGQPSCRTAKAAVRTFGTGVDMILDGGRLERMESTVISLLGEGIEVLRYGPVRVNQEARRR